MTFDERMAALGVDLSDIEMPNLFLMDYIEFIRALYVYFTEILDRMETRLDNVTRERDWLVQEYCGCESCINKDIPLTDEPCKNCGDSAFEWEGIPEDWRVDDENQR